MKLALAILILAVFVSAFIKFGLSDRETERKPSLHAALCPEQQRANANLCFNGLELRNPARRS